jgi:hypothetical protein
LTHHRSEKMLRMLEEILRLHVIPIQHGGAGKGQIALILSFGIGNRMLTAAAARRPDRAYP